MCEHCSLNSLKDICNRDIEDKRDKCKKPLLLNTPKISVTSGIIQELCNSLKTSSHTKVKRLNGIKTCKTLNCTGLPQVLEG